MKKVLLALMILVFVSGCTNVREMDLNAILDTGTAREVSMFNEHRVGYKYYVPRGMKNINYTEYNEKITDDKYTYYLYIDAVSYINKVIDTFEPNEKAYYSAAINHKDKFGYLEIKNVDDDKYLVEIMYNYAKIEVIVSEKDINIVVLNSLTILSSISYNDTILTNLMGDNILQFKEIEFNIFEPKDASNYLKFQEDAEQMQEEDQIHDSDLIN